MRNLNILKLAFFAAFSLLVLGCSGENETVLSFSEKAASAVPENSVIGPVSQYGELVAGSPDGVGHIYGKCSGVESGKEVQVKGMSLYWSLLPNATDFYTETAISTMVREMNVEIVRAAIGTKEDWGGTEGFIKDPESQFALIDQAVAGAVKNDIYIIFDWHSHTATEQLDYATYFFETLAQKYGALDNVIFELFNEPTTQSWADIKAYAEAIVAVIRKYSDNLILVGNPTWDQTPNKAIGNEVSDPLNNIAYTFHYYANTHSISSEGRNAERAMKAGLSVFVSEWGTGDADGGGVPNLDRNSQWQNWLDVNKLSWANWSASKIPEGTAAFSAASDENHLEFSESGSLVKSYLDSNPTGYKKCRKR